MSLPVIVLAGGLSTRLRPLTAVYLIGFLALHRALGRRLEQA